MRWRRGRYVVVEGPDCSGKTTLWRLLCESLRRAGARVACAREPWGPLGRIAARAPSPGLQALLYTLDRLWLLLAGGLGPCRGLALCLARGYTVVSDRGWPSTWAYQGCAGGSRLAKILAGLAARVMRPDRLHMLTPPAWEVKARCRGRGEEPPRMLERLLNCYRRLKRGTATVAGGG